MPKATIIQRREIFIEAVVRVIARQGIDKATTRTIATEAGTSLASLHYCFESKEALFLAAYEHLLTTLGELSLNVPKGIGLGPAVALVLQNMMQWYKSQEGYSQTQLEIAFWAYRQDRDFIQRHYTAILLKIEQALADAADKKDDCSVVNDLARVIISTIDGVVSQSLIYSEDGAKLDALLAVSAESLRLFAQSKRR